MCSVDSPVRTRAGRGADGTDHVRDGSVRPRGPTTAVDGVGEMFGLILAAGNGSRLAGAIGPRSKCLVDVGGRPLISLQIDALVAAGVRSVVVVVGYGADEVRATVGGRARFVENDRFAETNSLYSFHLAGGTLDDDAFILNCDVLFPPSLLGEMNDLGGCVVAFDSRSGGDDEHMKVQIDAGRLVRMGKDLQAHDVAGENLGVIRVDRVGIETMRRTAAVLSGSASSRAWMAEAVNGAAADHVFRALDVAGRPWTEIDFPEDLAVARVRVWPRVASEFDVIDTQRGGL